MTQSQTHILKQEIQQLAWTRQSKDNVNELLQRTKEGRKERGNSLRQQFRRHRTWERSYNLCTPESKALIRSSPGTYH